MVVAQAQRGVAALHRPRKAGGNVLGFPVEAAAVAAAGAVEVVMLPELMVLALAVLVVLVVELPMEASTSEAGGLCTRIRKGFSIAGTKLFKSLGENIWFPGRKTQPV